MNNDDIKKEALKRASITTKNNFTIPELFPNREWEKLLDSEPHNNGIAVSCKFKGVGKFADTGTKRNGRKVYKK